MGTEKRENQFVAAFDILVDSRNKELDFQRQALLVAEFVKCYVQILVELSDKSWLKLMRQHNTLHKKADAAERKGRNPIYLLEKQIESKDDLGRILRKYSAHLGALDCILDVRATAALVHHLIELPVDKNIPESITGCEMGAGTGVLSVVGSIPFLAKGVKTHLHTFELSTVARKDAQRISQVLKKKSKYKDLLNITAHQGDITSAVPYEIVVKDIQSSGPLCLWISETFGYRSKKPVILGDFSCSFEQPANIPPYSPDEEKFYDPFPFVVDLSQKYFNLFLEKIGKQEIIAFPDIVTPRVIIDGRESKLLTADGVWRKLSSIGHPYTMLPPCVPSRWYIAEKKQIKKGKNLSAKKKRIKRKFYTR